MNSASRFLAVAAVGGAMALAACGGSDLSPVGSTTAITGDSGSVTSSGFGSGNGYGPGPSDGFCGNACTGAVGPDPADIVTLLVEALQEEYKAEMLYRSVLQTFGAETVPFALIADAEARHVEALQTLFARRQMVPPASIWSPGGFAPFASVPLACAAGVTAEREDAAFYAPHLQRTDLPRDVRNVFTNLQRASLENHLPAFERCP